MGRPLAVAESLLLVPLATKCPLVGTEIQQAIQRFISQGAYCNEISLAELPGRLPRISGLGESPSPGEKEKSLPWPLAVSGPLLPILPVCLLLLA